MRLSQAATQISLCPLRGVAATFRGQRKHAPTYCALDLYPPVVGRRTDRLPEDRQQGVADHVSGVGCRADPDGDPGLVWTGAGAWVSECDHGRAAGRVRDPAGKDKEIHAQRSDAGNHGPGPGIPKSVSSASLPIWEIHSQVVETLRAGNRLVLVAPTGSGKTTQIPQMLLDAGLAGGKKIVVLQP